MISFADGSESQSDDNKYLEITKGAVKKLIQKLLAEDPYGEGSFHEKLSPTYIEEIITYLMYAENNDTIYLKIEKDLDEYHLNLTIGKKKKNG